MYDNYTRNILSKSELLNDLEILNNIYNPIINTFEFDIAKRDLVINRFTNPNRKFKDIYVRNSSLSLLIFDIYKKKIDQTITEYSNEYLQINKNNIIFEDEKIKISTEKIFFRCIILDNSYDINNTTNKYTGHLYMVDIIEDYFGFVKYNNTKVYKLKYVV